MGTTSSGAIDRVDEIMNISTCTRYLLFGVLTSFNSEKSFPDLWIHIDAAWAGVALSCPEYRECSYLDDINAHANSFSTNFHKVNSRMHFNLMSFLKPQTSGD